MIPAQTNAQKPCAVIFDMDGTLCDVSTIRHLVQGKERDFHSFHEESVNCLPHPHVLEAAKDAYASGLRVIIVTARKERYKVHTSWWLAINGVPSHALKMRANYDSRPDHEVKRDILNELRESYEIAHVWDDNPSVIEMWRSEGIPVTVVLGW